MIARAVKRWARRRRADAYRKTHGRADGLRSWKAAKTSRLNSKHWAAADDNPINFAISGDLDTLRMRSELEAKNNAIVEGVIGTHVDDIVGHDGPTLQVQSEDKSYNDKLEAGWREFWAMPDIAGVLSGVDCLQLWIRSMWTSGEFLAQITQDSSLGARDIQTRIQNIHSRRLRTPPGSVVDELVSLGVEKSEVGKPLAYHIEDSSEHELSYSTFVFKKVRADDIIHGFKMMEVGQSRGVPWLAPVLQTMADVSDYDEQVLDAVRAAADFGVVLSTTDPDAEYAQVNESAEIERRRIATAPPGWTPTQLKPEQPTVMYKEYRGERFRELGRVVGMPLMMVMLDSAGHSYSSARFDGQIYLRAIRLNQSWLQRVVMNRLLVRIEREMQLLGRLPGIRPAGVKFVWTWPAPPHVDPLKEAMADRAKMQDGTLPYQDALAKDGRDIDTVIEQRVSANEKLVAAGLPTVAEAVSKPKPVARRNPVHSNGEGRLNGTT